MSRKNGHKSAVGTFKKYKLHDRTGQPVVCRDTRYAQGHGPFVCSSSSTRQLGCVFQDVEHPKHNLRKNSDIQKPIQRVTFTKTIGRHAKIRDQKFLRSDKFAQGSFISGNPNAPKFEDRSQEERQSGKSKVPVKQRGGWPKVLLAKKSSTWGTRICCRLRSVNAHDQQKGLEFCWNGYLDEIVQSYDSHNSEWRSADAWRSQILCQRIGYILD